MVKNLPRQLRKGRGAASNLPSWYDSATAVEMDDGWGTLDEDLPPLRTTVGIDSTRGIIARNQSPDLPFDRSINPYRGCEHGCSYCFARPTHAYPGLSPGLDFETRLFAKPDAPALLDSELHKPGYGCRIIALGTNTDPYRPIEREHRITRGILKVLSAHNHLVVIVTKSALVIRDIDILADMASRRLARVYVSVTTLSRDLARALEPRAAAPPCRLSTIRGLVQAGIPTGAMVAPIIPALNDNKIEQILAAVAEAGTDSASYVLLRLPLEVSDLFREWLRVHTPLKASHVMSLVLGMRGERDYDSAWGQRMTGVGPYAEMIAKRFQPAKQRLGLAGRNWSLDVTRFRPPPRSGDQLSLL